MYKNITGFSSLTEHVTYCTTYTVSKSIDVCPQIHFPYYLIFYFLYLLKKMCYLNSPLFTLRKTPSQTIVIELIKFLLVSLDLALLNV